MNRTPMDCHQIEDVPGLYIDAFQSDFLKRINSVDGHGGVDGGDGAGSSNSKRSGDHCCLILTHYHSDHYQNLPRRRNASDGAYEGPTPIHCTPITASLLVRVHGVPSHLVIPHEYGQRWRPHDGRRSNRQRREDLDIDVETTTNDDGHDQEDDDEEAVFVTFYDANHCPGAAIVVVEVPTSSTTQLQQEKKKKIHIHTGDMRYHPKMKNYPLLMRRRTTTKEEEDQCQITKQQQQQLEVTAASSSNVVDVDVLYLDTTYGHPKHTFQTQEEAIDMIASQVEQCVSSSIQNQNHHKERKQQKRGRQQEQDGTEEKDDDSSATRTLVLLSCYSIGKEKVLWESAVRTNQRVYVSEKKLQMLKCIIDNTQSKIPTRTIAIKEGDITIEREDGSSNIVQVPNDHDEINSKHHGDHNLPCHRLVERCTRDPNITPLHVVPMGLAGEMWPYFQPNYRKCVDYYEDTIDFALCQPYDRIVAFIPTGWAEGSNWNKKNSVSSRRMQCRKDPNRYIDVEVRLISYSEHSSIAELEEFVRYLRPRKVIPTVFKDLNDRRRLENLFSKYVDALRAKRHFFRGVMPTSLTLTAVEAASAWTPRKVKSIANSKSINDNKSMPTSNKVTSQNGRPDGAVFVDLTCSFDETDEQVKKFGSIDCERRPCGCRPTNDKSSQRSIKSRVAYGASSHANSSMATRRRTDTRENKANPTKRISQASTGKHSLITQFFSVKKKTK